MVDAYVALLDLDNVLPPEDSDDPPSKPVVTPLLDQDMDGKSPELQDLKEPGVLQVGPDLKEPGILQVDPDLKEPGVPQVDPDSELSTDACGEDPMPLPSTAQQGEGLAVSATRLMALSMLIEACMGLPCEVCMGLPPDSPAPLMAREGVHPCSDVNHCTATSTTANDASLRPQGGFGAVRYDSRARTAIHTVSRWLGVTERQLASFERLHAAQALPSDLSDLSDLPPWEALRAQTAAAAAASANDDVSLGGDGSDDDDDSGMSPARGGGSSLVRRHDARSDGGSKAGYQTIGSGGSYGASSSGGGGGDDNRDGGVAAAASARASASAAGPSKLSSFFKVGEDQGQYTLNPFIFPGMDYNPYGRDTPTLITCLP